MNLNNIKQLLSFDTNFIFNLFLERRERERERKKKAINFIVNYNIFLL